MATLACVRLVESAASSGRMGPDRLNPSHCHEAIQANKAKRGEVWGFRKKKSLDFRKRACGVSKETKYNKNKKKGKVDKGEEVEEMALDENGRPVVTEKKERKRRRENFC